MTPARFRWGMVLILFGILILINNLGVVDFTFHDELFVVFLACFLIAVGIEKIFTKTRLQFISYLTTIGIFFCGLAFAVLSSELQTDGEFFSNSEYREDMDSSVKEINAYLNLEKSDLTIRDAGNDLVNCEFDKYTRKPRIKSHIDEFGIAHMDFIAREHSYLGGAIKIERHRAPTWSMEFSEDVPLQLECVGHDNDIHLNLSTSRLERLKLDTDNSKVYLVVSDNEPVTKVLISGDDSNLQLRLPEGVGVKFVSNYYQSYLEKFGLSKADSSSFVNDLYKDAEKKVEIDLQDSLSVFSLEFF